jgi:hypothetical protein
MSRTRLFRSLLLAALAATPNIVACSASDSSTDQNASTAGVVLEGDATAAQLNTVLERKALDWAWAGGQFDTPDDQATLAAETPALFSWTSDLPDFAEGGATGDAVTTYLLTFSAAGTDKLLRVFTTLTQYTPDTATWQKLVAAGQPITLSITTATFLGADLPQGGGPFSGQTLSFTIE